MPDALPRVTLVLGGARSGKSRHAETLIRALPSPWSYIATAQPFDAEMQERIARHQEDRSEGWITVEEPLDLAAALRAQAGGPVLVDCLTLWLSNLMLSERDPEMETGRLLAALDVVAGPVVLVSNEVGMGIVPDNALARAFRDAAGRLNQRVAAMADRVVLVVAGLPLTVKQETSHG
ncbi:bifunctional adenosylcobinamide kinase/adenosylcobinamide-phosphate guanylyltransferase [Indioceanicola profundi]|uniref:bifunctional adenosylcobinamide kinase/adenosylcobinamide-phosphate guanylyltransferase n=1 Tax=Indioceanicola profundi TaxID=2220096 RepID=UPI000E6AA15C|nr:bifunctional adenosylcobinamide kinase/adenosylcobinamide-phosphate guanylyltransferase [Indioceanicola profundi]